MNDTQAVTSVGVCPSAPEHHFVERVIRSTIAPFLGFHYMAWICTHCGETGYPA